MMFTVDESISSARQSYARGMPASTLSSEICTVQVLEGPKNLSALQNSELPAFGSIFLNIVFNGTSIGTVSNGRISKVAAIGRCLLREVPLYMWQPCVEIEGYSVAYFDCIVAFEAPYR